MSSDVLTGSLYALILSGAFMFGVSVVQVYRHADPIWLWALLVVLNGYCVAVNIENLRRL